MTTQTQHTQGPWLINCDDGEGISIIGHPTADIHRAARGSQHLATVVYDDKAQVDYLPHTPSHETAKANAHLIAAAPDMLNEHKNNENLIHKHMAEIEAGEWTFAQITKLLVEIQNNSRAAIARARG